MDTTHWPQGIGVVRAVTMEGSNKQAINNNNGINNNNTNTSNAMQLDQRRSRPPQKDQALNCPRCNSTNTKFCYYNNYSLTQPRYFCKTCRRYWTEGGSLRNVPVGGGSRKNKRSSSSSTSTSTSSTTSTTSSQPMSLAINKKLLIHDHHNPNISPLLPPSLSFPLQSASQSPKLIHQGQDLNLAYPPTAHDHHHHDHHHNMTRISFLHHDHLDPYNSGTHNGMANPSTASPTDTTTTTTTCSSSQQVSAMELLKTGMASRGGLGAFMAMPMPMPIPMTAHANAGAMFSSPPPPTTTTTTGFSNLLGGNVHHEFKPSLSFGLDQYDHQAGGYNNGDNNLHDHGVQENSGTNNSTARLLFPNDHQDLKQVSSNNTTNTTTTDHHDDHDRHGRHQFDQQINRGQGDHNSASGYNWNGMLGGGSW